MQTTHPSTKPWRKWLFIALALILVVAVPELLARAYFAAKGYHVGSLAPNWQQVHHVDTLAVSHSYYTDSTGIFKADKVFWGEQGVAINQYGFRGKGFMPDTTGKGLLLLGDSFTWGAGANPLDSCLADRLTASTYTVYNTGIPGADPAQYALIADSLVPKLRPAYTALLFYLGNDVVDTLRPTLPNQPIYYVTNTGWLPAYYQGQYLPSADSAYRYYLQLYTPKGTLAKLATHTALGTLLLSLPLRMHERQHWQALKQLPYSNQYLQHIAQTCLQNHSQLVVFAIPFSGTDLTKDFDSNPKAFVLKQYPAIFKGLQSQLYILPMTPGDYLPLPDGHFNNKGHGKAAAFVQQVLDSLSHH